MNDLYRDVELAAETYHADGERGERIIRAFLLVGFLAVLVIEGWLLWQWLQMLA